MHEAEENGLSSWGQETLCQRRGTPRTGSYSPTAAHLRLGTCHKKEGRIDPHKRLVLSSVHSCTAWYLPREIERQLGLDSPKL